MESPAKQGRFHGQIAVVTGGGSGIGKACAEQLAREGATVVIADQNQDGAQSVATAIGGRAYTVDVGDPEAVELFAQRVEADVGPVSVLVNSAGILQGAAVPPEEISMEVYDRVFAVNMRGTFASCVAFGRRMALRQKGSILNIASISGIRSTPLHAYGPMKAAIIQLTENLATEWGRSGVRVNCLSPGAVLSPAMQVAIDKGQRNLALLKETAAAGEVVMPAQVALAAAFLLSDDASAITGVNLPVDHGWLVANSWAMFGGVRQAARSAPPIGQG